VSPLALLAHGLGDPADLPVPFGIVLWVVGASVLGAAALTGRHTRTRPSIHDRCGAMTPQRSWIHPAGAAASGALQAVMLVALGAVVVLAVAGPHSAAVNPVPRLVYVVFWAGLVPLSLLLGGVWRSMNPVRLLAAGLARVIGDPDDHTVRPVPGGLGVWPAAVLLGVFVWGELALGAQPRLTLMVVMVVLLATLAGTVRHGRAWLDGGDPFEVYSALLGALSPLHRDTSGRPAVRSPRARLVALPSPAGLGAVLAVLVGADVFDGLLGVLAWQNLKVGLPTSGRVLMDTAGLAASVLLVGLLGRLCTRGARDLLPALLPVVAAYAVAHYVPVLLVDAQVALGQASDPLGRGWDLFGTAGWTATYDMLPDAALAAVLLLVLVAGHVAAVVVAGDRAAAAYGRDRAARARVPLQALVVGSALASVAIRFSGG
jgi:hypothetical protein